MDFSTNFIQKTTLVLQEACKLKKYKAMPVALAVVVGLFLLPLFAAGILAAAALYVFGYIFSIVSLPTTKLHKLLHDEGQSLSGAGQFAVYFLSWTFIFSTYAVLSFMLILLGVMYSVFAILTYLWTLGGIKFHVSADVEDISVEVEGKYNMAIPVIFVVVAVVLFLVEKIGFRFGHDGIAAIRRLFALVYVMAVFAPGPKKAIETPVQEEVPAE